MSSTYKIHPAIGFARVGNFPDHIIGQNYHGNPDHLDK
ncbi:MAG: hypothetical protein RL748_1966, partial [Pseudomonadota bacterium]